MVLEKSWAKKWMSWAFEKGIFQGITQFFANIWETKLKPLSGKVAESVENCLNQNLVWRSFLGNGFEVALSSKRNVVSA